MLVRHRPQRVGASAALALLLVACAGVSAEVPQAAVAGVQVARDGTVATPGVADRPVANPTPGAPATKSPPAATPAATSELPFLPPPPVLERPAGDRVRSEVLNGVERQWTVVVPPGTKDDRALPVLVVLHGVGGKGAAMRKLGFERFAGPSGAIVVYPDATGGSWNDGRPGMEPLSGTPVDDVAFLRTVIDRTIAEFGADPSRVAIVGFSNGALMASRAACDMADRLSSVVLVSGAGPRDMAQRCHPSRPLSVMVVFGTNDQTVPYQGGSVASYGGRSRGMVTSVADFLAVWRGANGCSSDDSREPVAGSTKITVQRGRGCRADMVHYRIDGGAHEWFSTTAFDTTTEAWRFMADRFG